MKSSSSSRLLGALEDSSWLGRADSAVSGLVGRVLDVPGASGLLDALHGRWLGHPLHPALSDLPIGLWSGSVLLDWLGGRWSATTLSLAGTVASVATAASGLADWTATDGRERRLGLFHGLVNAAALGLQLASLGCRIGCDHRRARRLSTLAWLTSLGAAYVGGELVFGRGLMVDHTAWTAGPGTWTQVLTLSELEEGGSRKVEVEGRGILLHRRQGRVQAFEDACSHAGGPLSEGRFENGSVICPWHGSAFRLSDGAVLKGPATFPLLRLQARVSKGAIEVRGRRG